LRCEAVDEGHDDTEARRLLVVAAVAGDAHRKHRLSGREINHLMRVKLDDLALLLVEAELLGKVALRLTLQVTALALNAVRASMDFLGRIL
jgi:hypothetical protein